MNIKRRVAVLAVDSERVVCDLHRERVALDLAAGIIVINEIVAGVLVSVRQTTKLATSEARPGSYGVNRQHLPVGKGYGLSGGVVFSPKRTWERELAA